MWLLDFFRKKITWLGRESSNLLGLDEPEEIVDTTEDDIQVFYAKICSVGAKICVTMSVDNHVSSQWGSGGIKRRSTGWYKCEVDVKPRMDGNDLRDYFNMPSLQVIKQYAALGNYVITFTAEDLEHNRKMSTQNIFTPINMAIEAFDKAKMDARILIYEKYSFMLDSLENTLEEMNYRPSVDMAKKISLIFEMIESDFAMYAERRYRIAESSFDRDLDILVELDKREKEKDTPLKMESIEYQAMIAEQIAESIEQNKGDIEKLKRDLGMETKVTEHTILANNEPVVQFVTREPIDYSTPPPAPPPRKVSVAQAINEAHAYANEPIRGGRGKETQVMHFDFNTGKLYESPVYMSEDEHGNQVRKIIVPEPFLQVTEAVGYKKEEETFNVE